MVKAKTWVKLREFSGTPTKDDFTLVEEDLPQLKDGGRVVLFLFHKLLAKTDQDNSRRTAGRGTWAPGVYPHVPKFP